MPTSTFKCTHLLWPWYRPQHLWIIAVLSSWSLASTVSSLIGLDYCNPIKLISGFYRLLPDWTGLLHSLQLVSGFYRLLPDWSPLSPGLRVQYVPHRAAAMIILKQKLDHASALLQTSQCLPISASVKAKSSHRPARLCGTWLCMAASSSAPASLLSLTALRPQRPPGYSSITSSQDPCFLCFAWNSWLRYLRGCFFNSMKFWLTHEPPRKTCAPSPLWNGNCHSQIPYTPFTALVFWMSYIFYINFMLRVLNCLTICFFKSEAFNFLFTAVSLTPKIVLVT